MSLNSSKLPVMNLGELMNRFTLQWTVLFGLALASFPMESYASENKIALVIGNGQYTHAGPLKHPGDDASAMAEKLQNKGFKVTAKKNLTLKEMHSALDSFSAAKKDSILIFYYAGHAMQIEGKNYFLPVDFNPDNLQFLQNSGKGLKEIISTQALNMTRVLSIMENSHPKLMILILDACRNNDLGLDVRGGLAEVHANPGTLFAYAAKPGGVAYDGGGEHSLYTDSLLKYMDMTCVSLNDMLNTVGKTVYEKTKAIISKHHLQREPQQPWVSHSPMTSFSFSGCRNWEELENLLNRFKTAFERENLTGVKKVVDLNYKQESYINEIFDTFHDIEIQTSHPNLKSPGFATAKAKINAAVNSAGNLVTPPTQWGSLYLQLRKDGEHWGKMKLEWGLDHER